MHLNTDMVSDDDWPCVPEISLETGSTSRWNILQNEKRNIPACSSTIANLLTCLLPLHSDACFKIPPTAILAVLQYQSRGLSQHEDSILAGKGLAAFLTLRPPPT